jgi:hypothetical protein
MRLKLASSRKRRSQFGFSLLPFIYFIFVYLARKTLIILYEIVIYSPPPGKRRDVRRGWGFPP